MPAQELPKVLRNLMDTLMDGNQLHSWNIFEERNGQIVVKIKFSGGHIDQPQQASYKRKSPNQVRRDHSRTEAGVFVNTSPTNNTWGHVIFNGDGRKICLRKIAHFYQRITIYILHTYRSTPVQIYVG